MAPAGLALIAWAAAIAAGDFARRRIPNFALLPVVLIAAALPAIQGSGLLGVSPAASLFGGAIALALLPAYAAGGLGAGDVKLASTMGLLLGPGPMALVLVLAALLLGAAAWWIAKMRPAARAHIPAAPMLAAAFTAVLGLAAVA